MHKRTVVISFLGTKLDAGFGIKRWKRWRPTLSLFQPGSPEKIERLELFTSSKHRDLAQQVRADIGLLAPQVKVNAVSMEVENPWDFSEMYATLYDWARAYPFDPQRESYWVHITTGTHVAQICLFLLVESRLIPGLLLQTAPPRGGMNDTRTPGSHTLIDLDLSRYDRLAQRFDAAKTSALDFLKGGIATRNATFNALIAEIEQVAVRSDAPVLLTGPTGAGKSHLARRMYQLKKARHQVAGAFVEINCATLRGDSAASTLFGHKKGAFTGAASERAGLLRTADKGVLFLDEIGELGADEQAMLLKAVEEKRFLPMGCDREVSSDFQLIAGTHRDLRREVRAGRFREDLFARINLWSYELPSLAQRAEDIEPNIDHLLALAVSATGRAARFHPQARARYLEFAMSQQATWRGNFRDLSASITRLATLAQAGRISVALVEAEIQRLRWLWQEEDEEDKDSNRPAYHTVIDSLIPAEIAQTLDLFDQLQLQAVLTVCRQCRSLSEAGRRLFQHSRTQRRQVNDADRLRKYLARFGLTLAQINQSLALE